MNHGIQQKPVQIMRRSSGQIGPLEWTQEKNRLGRASDLGARGGEICGWDPGDFSRSPDMRHKLMNCFKNPKISLDPKHSRYEVPEKLGTPARDDRQNQGCT